MNNALYQPISKAIRMLLIASLAVVFALGAGQTQTVQAFASPAPVNLGTASTFVILTEAGVTNVPNSAITGNIGVSPITYASITGFGLMPVVPDVSTVFSTSAQVTGQIFAADYADPTPANMTAAIGDMETAYTDAAGRTLPNATELYSGDLSGRTLAPGLYKWSSGVLINTSLTLRGPANGVWIFQIAGDLTVGSGAQVVLTGGAQAKNVFWQVGGGAGVELGTTSHMEGNLLAATAIHLRTGASLNGRAFAQTEVTLDQNTVVLASSVKMKRRAYSSVPGKDGWVLESSENSGVGGTKNHQARTLQVGDDANNNQYVSVLHFSTGNLPNGAIITSVVLKVYSPGVVGTDPFSTHGNLLVDISKPWFGVNSNLAISDFEAVASDSAAGAFDVTPANNWYSVILDSSSFSYINLTGSTQFRLRFATDDNDDLIADYITFMSGGARPQVRPRLIVNYYVP